MKNFSARLGLLALLAAPLAAPAQTTFTLSQVPANTPAGATLYLAGTFNNWNPAAPGYALTRDAATGTYRVTVPAGVIGAVEYKFTRGSWPTVETDAQNRSIPNRQYAIAAPGATVTHQVLNWEDLGPRPTTRTANVSILSDTFRMPQLGGRQRRVWLYLPNDYATSSRRYPVLYMHDGQNVFDQYTSFAGEWGVDETLSQLQASGQDLTGCIVVAVDNGGTQRLNEYSPWVNPSYGGGQGAQYVDFLVQTLKPYVDQRYRTLAGRAHTGIAGSSMGALISTYAALRYPAVFGKVGVFSPAYWFAFPQLLAYVRTNPPQPDTRFYFVSGTNESLALVPQMQAVRDSLQAAGVPAANLNFNTLADGQHAEWFWRREFPAAYQWLYAPTAPLTTAQQSTALLTFYPNPVADELRVQLPASGAAQLEIRDALGRPVLRQTLRPGQTALDVRALAPGLYWARAVANGAVSVGRFCKE